MPPNPGDNCKIKVAVRVRPFNRRGKRFLKNLSLYRNTQTLQQIHLQADNEKNIWNQYESD